MDETKELAHLAKIAYLPKQQRQTEAERLGFSITDQDDDRVLLTKDNRAVISLRGTDLKQGKRGVRDLLTDTAIVFGSAEKTPRYIANEQFLVKAMEKGLRPEVVGHSLGGHGAVVLGKDYGVKATAFNPAFGIKEIATSFRDRVTNRKHKNVTIHTTTTDPISMGASFSLTGNVRRKRATKDNPHSLSNFL